jgi:hypothetical protein
LSNAFFSYGDDEDDAVTPQKYRSVMIPAPKLDDLSMLKIGSFDAIVHRPPFAAALSSFALVPNKNGIVCVSSL